MRKKFLSKNLRGRKNDLEDLVVDGRILLKCIFGETEWKCVQWIYLDLDRDQWRALVNTVMNIRVP